MKPVRLVTAIIVLALAAAGSVIAWKTVLTTEVPLLITAAVVRGDVEQTVLASGTLKPIKLVAVGAQVSGRITSVRVALGQTVAQGDLIAEIDSITQQNALRTANASLDSIRAQKVEKQATLALNQTTLARQQSMVAQRAVSQADYDSAVAAVGVTQAQIAALDAQIVAGEVAIETANANLGYTRITAPTGGTVLSIVSQEGQTVNATQSAPTIVILGQLDTMTVRTEISEADIVNVKPGQPVYFTVLGDRSKRYDATLQSIEPAPESITSDSSITTSISSSSSSSSTSSSAIYYNGIFDVPNPDGRLRTYMTAEVHIVLGKAEKVLVIPSAALGAQDADGRWNVRVAGADGQIAVRKVEIGLNNKVTAEVRSGIAENERVIIGEMSATTPSGGGINRGNPPPMRL